MALAALSTVVIAFETEAEAKARLEAFGYAPEIAGEITVCFAQSTDLPQFAGEIAEALGPRQSRPGSFRSANFPRAWRTRAAPRCDDGIGVDRTGAVLSPLRSPGARPA